MKNFQIVNYFPEWVGLKIYHYPKPEGLGYIYSWILAIGFIEIRRWK